MVARKINEYIEEGETTRIVLDKGQFATIDTVMIPIAKEFCWYARLYEKTGTYYVVSNVRGKRRSDHTVFLHHVLTGKIPGMIVDHKNGDTLYNTVANLRQVTHSQNEQNRNRINRNSSTGIRGVSRWKHRGQLKVTAVVNRKAYHGGYFPDTPEGLIAAEEAAIALRQRIHTHSDGR